MELYEAMRTTRATRSFTDELVDDQALSRILHNARFAPSGGNRQPWRVIAVRDGLQKRRLREQYVLAYREFPNQRTLEFDLLAERLDDIPVLLVVCVELAALNITDAALERPSVVGGASIYPFVQNILLGLREEGLAGLLTTLICAREPHVREILAIPDGFAICCLIPVGHAIGPPGKGGRRPVENFAWFDRFGHITVASPDDVLARRRG